MNYLEAAEQRAEYDDIGDRQMQERRYRRWIWERRLRRWGPCAVAAAMAVLVFWLARR